MSFTNLSILDVSYDDKAYGNLIDPYEWNQNFLKIEQIFNQNKQIIEDNFNSVSSSNIPSEAIEELGQTLPSTVREQLLLIVNLLSTKVSPDEVNSSISGLLKSAVLDENTGIVTFTKYDGSTFTIDFATEKIPAKFELVDSDGNVYLKITNIDGSFTQTDVTSLLNIYLFNDSSNIEFTVDGYNVTTKIKSGSIVKSDFSSDLISYFDDNVAAAAANALSSETSKLAAESAKNDAESARDSALNSENNAKTYRDSSEQNHLLSKSYAVGGSGIRANEATDNAEYYMNQAKSYRDSVVAAKDIAVAASEGAKSSESKAEEYKNSTSLMKDEVASMLLETQTAKDESISAKNESVSARDESVSARDESVSAKEYSVAAKEAAETAKNESISAKEDAIAAKTAAETARDQAQEIAGGDFATKAELTQGLSTKQDLITGTEVTVLAKDTIKIGDIVYTIKGDTLEYNNDIYSDNGTTALSSNVYSVSFSPDGNTLVLGGWFTGYAKVYSVSGNTITYISDIYSDNGTTALSSDVQSVTFSPDGNTLVLGGNFKGGAKVYTWSKMAYLSSNPEFDSALYDIAISKENISLNAKGIIKKIISVDNSQLSKKPSTASSILSSSGWNGNVYSFESDFPESIYDIEVEIDGDSCTAEQLKSWNSAQIVGSSTTNSCKALGDVPTIDIPIIIKAVVK